MILTPSELVFTECNISITENNSAHAEMCRLLYANNLRRRHLRPWKVISMSRIHDIHRRDQNHSVISLTT